MNKFWRVFLISILLFGTFFIADKSYAGTFTPTQRTSGGNTKWYPQQQVVGTKIYYVWVDENGFNDNIYTAEMNTDGTGWSVTQRTSNNTHKDYPQLQVVGTKIYYVWSESDGSNAQIWTASMDTDGNNWGAFKRTTTTVNKYAPQMQVDGTKIYYVWQNIAGFGADRYQIWTASMDTDGNNWSAFQRTSSNYYKDYPQLQVSGTKIYYVWQQDNGSGDNQIWTGIMNTDGTGWSETQRTTTQFYIEYPQLQVDGTKIYYVWQAYSDGSYAYEQIWTGVMNTDGTGWSETQRTTNDEYKEVPQLQVDGTKIYYVWDGDDGTGTYQIYTAEMNTDGTGWSEAKRTTSAIGYYAPQLQASGENMYYVFQEVDTIRQIWTAIEDIFINPISADVDVTGIVDPAISFSLSSNVLDIGNINYLNVSKSNTVTLTMTTNAANGYSVVVKDEGNGATPGLYSSILSTLIATTTGTLVAGTDGYGLSATSGTEIIASAYDKTSPDVGALSRTYQDLVSNIIPVDTKTATIDVSAAVSSVIPAGTYFDTLTLVCTGNF